MLNENCTTKLFGLQGVIIKKVRENDKNIELGVELPKHPQVCPECGCVTARIHDYRNQKVKDMPIRNKKVIINLHKRRYVCPGCGKRFYERNEWLSRYKRMTHRMIEDIFLKLKDSVSFKHVANELNISVSTVCRYFDALNIPGKALPEVLCIDEFKGNTGKNKYQCILLDGVSGEIIDILPNRDKATLEHYFSKKNVKDVRFLVSDLWDPYFNLVQNIFPKARHIADKYHVIRQAVWSMEAIRKELQKQLNTTSRIHYKHSAHLLRSSFERMKEGKKAKLLEILSTSRELSNAYWIKEDFLNIFRCETVSEAKEAIHKWCIEASESGYGRFIQNTKMLGKWEKSIVNAIKYGYSNGKIEGTNNKIKVLKRVSYGMRNFDRFRNRILFVAYDKT